MKGRVSLDERNLVRLYEKAADSVREHSEFVKELRRTGVGTMLAGAQQTPQVVVSKIEMSKNG